MKSFFVELHQRNPLLSVFGWISFGGGIICAVMTQLDDTIVLGINAFIKPMKFFFSITIFCWTMAWYLFYLQQPRKAMAYSIMAILLLSFELFAVTWQAANGRLSHFNIDSSFYLIIYNLMGIAIVTVVGWTAYITFLFFRKKDFNLPKSYVWGIRFGLILFVIFSFEGGLMASRLAHTVGAPDGGPGLPVVNWSKQYGDLRVAHFLGMHALQIIPLFAYFVAKKPGTVALFSTIYFIFTMALFIQALKSIPLFF